MRRQRFPAINGSPRAAAPLRRARSAAKRGRHLYGCEPKKARACRRRNRVQREAGFLSCPQGPFGSAPLRLDLLLGVALEHPTIVADFRFCQSQSEDIFVGLIRRAGLMTSDERKILAMLEMTHWKQVRDDRMSLKRGSVAHCLDTSRTSQIFLTPMTWRELFCHRSREPSWR
jgi:hypothetical protein